MFAKFILCPIIPTHLCSNQPVSLPDDVDLIVHLRCAVSCCHGVFFNQWVVNEPRRPSEVRANLLELFAISFLKNNIDSYRLRCLLPSCMLLHVSLAHQ